MFKVILSYTGEMAGAWGVTTISETPSSTPNIHVGPLQPPGTPVPGEFDTSGLMSTYTYI